MIEILDQPPIILTKDSDFMTSISKINMTMKPGRFILLPGDAVLVKAPEEPDATEER